MDDKMTMAAKAGRPTVRVLAASALRGMLIACANEIAQREGIGFELEFGTSGAINKRIRDGEKFDLVASAREALADLAASGLVDANAHAIGVSKLAMGIRADESAPDISSGEKFRDVLLRAKSISRGDPAGGGTAGNHLVRVFAQLGVTEDVGAKSILRAGGFAVMKEVAERRADFGLTQSTEIPAVDGVKIGAYLPDDVQLATVYCIAPMARSEAGAKVIAYLASAPARAMAAGAGFAPA